MTPCPVNRLMFDLMVHDDRHVLSDLPTPGFHGPLRLGLPPSPVWDVIAAFWLAPCPPTPCGASSLSLGAEELFFSVFYCMLV